MESNILTKLDKKIDKIDQKILKELAQNARTPISVLAKKLLISKQACYYRLKRLEKEQVISGYKTKINLSLLGYSSFCIYIKLMDITEEQENFIISQIIARSYVRWFVTSTGRWDMMMTISAKDNIEYNSMIKEILKIIGERVLHYETAILLSSNDIWLKDRTSLKNDLQESYSEERIVIDDIDRKILEILQNNCRTELINIATAVKLTPEAINYRIKRLWKDGVIHSYILTINKDKLGLMWYQIQFLLKNIDHTEEKKLLSRIKMIEDVGYVIWMIGKWNFEADIYCESVDEFRRILMKIRSLMSGYIREYDTNIILKKYKSKIFVTD